VGEIALSGLQRLTFHEKASGRNNYLIEIWTLFDTIFP
jgi:hypothetical protein